MRGPGQNLAPGLPSCAARDALLPPTSRSGLQGWRRCTPFAAAPAAQTSAAHGASTSPLHLCRSFMCVFLLLCLCAGYSKKIKGKTAEERLDMRAAMKVRTAARATGGGQHGTAGAAAACPAWLC